MHIAIDDTYGPEVATNSQFVTENRRTHVAIVFSDSEVADVRQQVTECLGEVGEKSSSTPAEFHFVDIYNRKKPWDSPDGINLCVFKFFAEIYRCYQWSVFVQTVDDRTLTDHGVKMLAGKVDGLNLSNRADVSLQMLLVKIKTKYKANPEPITLLLDEGRGMPGRGFGPNVFHDWPKEFHGSYASSRKEPLLQIADFIAFCVNRSTHLALKKRRTETDNWFLSLVGNMKINSDDLKMVSFVEGFGVDDFDAVIQKDRDLKGLS